MIQVAGDIAKHMQPLHSSFQCYEGYSDTAFPKILPSNRSSSKF